jgi:hypothetical protein
LTPTGRTTGTVVQLRTVAGSLAKTADDERRYAPRRRVLKAAVAAFNDRFCTVSCTVRDLSDTGARLRCDGSINVPDTFELIIELDGFEAACQVAWRKGSDLGVRFLGAPKKVAPKRDQVISANNPAPAPSLRRKPIK